MDLAKLDNILEKEPHYRLKQVDHAIYSQLVGSWDEATALPKNLREVLKRDCPLPIEAEVFQSRDGKTFKAAIRLDDGEAVEAVLVRHRAGRNTVCVSSQAGCAMGCGFCLTGRGGFRRNLSEMEIVAQVLFFARRLKLEGARVTNVVVMGMGEPFLNYEEVMGAVRRLNRPDLLNIGARRISISTVGVVEGIQRLAREKLQVNLAISLHAPDDRRRDRLMPANRKYPIGKVMEATTEYIKQTRRRVMIEYVMLKGVNDSPADAKKLAARLKKGLGGLFFVNLIACNPGTVYEPSAPESVVRFKEALEKEGITVVERFRFGREIEAACGQLAGKR